MSNLYQKQTMVRNKLRSKADSVMKNMLYELQNNNQFDTGLERLILRLQQQFKSSKGKKVYGHLQPNVKKQLTKSLWSLPKIQCLKRCTMSSALCSNRNTKPTQVPCRSFRRWRKIKRSS